MADGFDVIYYLSPGRSAPSERQTFFRLPFPDAITVPGLNLDCGKISWIKYMFSIIYSKNLNLDDFNDQFEIFFNVKYGIFRKLIKFLLSQRIRGRDITDLKGLAIGEQWLSRKAYMRLGNLIERLNELIVDIDKIMKDHRRQQQFIRLFLTRDVNQWCIGRRFRLEPDDIRKELILPIYTKYHKTGNVNEKYAAAIDKASEQIAILLRKQVSLNGDRYFPFSLFLMDVLGVKNASDVASLLELRKTGEHPLLLNVESDLENSTLELNEESSAFLVYILYKRSKISHQAYRLLLSFLLCNYLIKIGDSNNLESFLTRASYWICDEEKFKFYLQNIKLTLKEFGLHIDIDFDRIFQDVLNQALWWELTLFMDSAEKLVRAVIDAIGVKHEEQIPISQIKSDIAFINWENLKSFLERAAKGKYNQLKNESRYLADLGLIDNEKAQSYINFLSEIEIHSSTTGRLDSLEKILTVLFKQQTLTEYGVGFNGYFFIKEDIGAYQYKEGPRIISVFLKWITKDLKI